MTFIFATQMPAKKKCRGLFRNIQFWFDCECPHFFNWQTENDIRIHGLNLIGITFKRNNILLSHLNRIALYRMPVQEKILCVCVVCSVHISTLYRDASEFYANERDTYLHWISAIAFHRVCKCLLCISTPCIDIRTQNVFRIRQTLNIKS